MGKLALMLVLALAGAAVLHGSASGDGLRENARQAGEQQRLAVARTAAKTGWARAKQALVADFVSGTVSGNNGGATYTTTVVVTGNEAIVTSVGSVLVPGRSATTDYQIVYRLESVGGDELPAFAEYAVAVDGDLSISGNGAIVEPGVTGAAANDLALRVHANGNLDSGSNSTIIQGFGSYTTSKSGKLTSTFRPISNPSGESVLAQKDSVSIPSVVPADILAAYGGAATTYPATTDLMDVMLINMTLPGGTRENPVVYYVPGGALLQNVTFSGYAIFVADEMVKFKGVVQGTPTAGTTESALAVFTPGYLQMDGGAEAYASVVAGGGLSYNGNVDIWGNFAVGGDFSHGGGATVHYVPAPETLYRAWGVGDPALRLLAYREQ